MNDPRVSDDDFLHVEANGCPMSSCAAPAGSPCRTGRGWVAAQYHTARFRLVPQLAKALSVPVPPLRKPGSSWTELPRPPAPDAAPAGHARVGYARASTIRQSLDTQVDSLRGGRHPDLRREDLHPRVDHGPATQINGHPSRLDVKAADPLSKRPVNTQDGAVL